jgi:hypothetical protein
MGRVIDADASASNKTMQVALDRETHYYLGLLAKRYDLPAHKIAAGMLAQAIEDNEEFLQAIEADKLFREAKNFLPLADAFAAVKSKPKKSKPKKTRKH